jgi:hypothetical protein
MGVRARKGVKESERAHVPSDNAGMNLDQDAIIADTRRWMERAVIGLNLCPFAKAVHVKEQIRWTVSEATTPEALLDDLVAELQFLAEADPEAVDTTLLIHPEALQDFLDFNDFLDLADAALEALELDGVLQVASFHPDYQYAGTDVLRCSALLMPRCLQMRNSMKINSIGCLHWSDGC